MPELVEVPSTRSDEIGGAGELLDLLASRPEWHRDALCKEYTTVNFFPASGEDPRDAKAICRACLVQAACLAWALGQDRDPDGVWGGTSKRERARLRKQQRRAA